MKAWIELLLLALFSAMIIGSIVVMTRVSP
jgi:hypothetical protein